MSSNPITTGRVGRVVYDLRHWQLTLLVAVAIGLPTLVFRVLSGRNLFRGGGRTTDATFFRRASSVRASWWNDLRGVERAGLRLALIAGVWLWTVAPIVVYILLGLELVVVGLSVYRRSRDKLHERTVLRPVWPAVAGIIGIPETEPPSRWLDIPSRFNETQDNEITVGLRAADADDRRRIDQLVTLFSQRYGMEFYGWVDYSARLAHIGGRPEEPTVWPAVATTLGVSATDLAQQWLTVPDSVDPGAKITVYLPRDVVDIDPIRHELTRLVNQSFPGDWRSDFYRVDQRRVDDPLLARIDLTRQHPKSRPPQVVNFFETHPDYSTQSTSEVN